MTNRSLIQTYQPRGEIGPTIPDTPGADRKAVETPLLIDDLWRQIDRWVNEGGAVGDGTTPSGPEMIANHRKSQKAARLPEFLVDLYESL
jgi:hypothetical protein